MTSFASRLEKKGQFPGLRLEITPLGQAQSRALDYFTTYQFSSSMMIPVDAFSFTLSAPEETKSFIDYIKEGDIASIYADNVQISTGIIDQIEIEVDGESGETATIHGRDMVGQLEDNSAVSINAKPFYTQNQTLIGAAKELINNTRIKNVVSKDAPTTPTLFATEPGETRLSALMRMMEPLNCLAWSSPDGDLYVGKPDFAQKEKGTLICSKKKRFSNVFSMRATYSATSIPNRVVVLWSDVQNTAIGLSPNQIFENNAAAPKRLLDGGHNVIKTVITSMPNGADAQSAAATAQFQVARAADTTILQALAKRELARANFNEVIINCVVPGHFNDNGELYKADTCYVVDFDRGNILEKMYCYAVEWNLTPERGQYTILSLCKLGTIVADVRIR